MKEKFLKVTKPGFGERGYYIPLSDLKNGVLGEIEAMVEYGEINDACVFTLVEHDREDFDEAPDFTGW